jgi:sec-independent protein translocase protein TatC
MTESEEKTHQPLIAHLQELRRRLLWAFLAMGGGTVLCLFFAKEIYGILVRPLAAAMGPHDTQRLIYTGLTEAFMTYMKVAFFAGVILTLPILLSQIWMFIAPGLYKNERKAFMPFLVATPLLFFAGAAMAYFIVMPAAYPFFLGFQSTAAETVLPIQLEARIGDYLNLVMSLMFAFGLCFELPVLLLLLGRAGIVTAESLVKFRRFAIVGAFAVAAVLTPPDILSQLLLAIPLWLMYEVSIISLRATANKRELSDEKKSYP